MMTRYLPAIRAIVSCILAGIFDSLRLPSTLVFFLSSVTVRVRTLQCIVLNGVIFLGSILLADFLLAPTLRALLAIGGLSTMETITTMPMASAAIPMPSNTSEHQIGAWMNVIFLYAYQLLWIYPLYAISFILNAIWYQDIADHAFITHGGSSSSKSITFQKWVATMSDEVYRLLLVTAYMLQMTLSSFIPYGIGNFLVLCQLCWMYSLYSFEYKWSLLGWSLEYRLKYFEKHWAYFLGFGAPAVAISLLFPKFISLGIFALSFPIFIILAIIAHPVAHSKKMMNAAAGSSTKGSKEKEKEKLTASGDPNQHHSMNPKSHEIEKHSTATSTTSAPILLAQLPIFRIATLINWWLLSHLQRRSKQSSRRPSIDATAKAKLTTADVAST